MQDASLHATAHAASVATLTPLERQCLAVLAAYRVPRNRTEHADALRDAGLRTPMRNGDRFVSASALTLMVDRWKQLGLVVDGRFGTYACTPDVAHATLSDPCCRELLQAMRRAAASGGDRAYEPDATPRLLRLTRLALYCGDPAEADRALALAKLRAYSRSELYEDLLDPRAPASALGLMSSELRSDYLAHILPSCWDAMRLPSKSMLEAAAREPAQAPLAVMLAAISGDVHDTDAWLGGDASPLAIEARAVAALARGDFETARTLAERVLTTPTGRHKPLALAGPLAPLLTLALATGTREQAALARVQLARVTRKGRIAADYTPVAILLNEAGAELAYAHASRDEPGLLHVLCIGLVLVFSGESSTDGLRDALDQVGAELRDGWAHWLAAQVETVALQLSRPPLPPTAAARALGGLLTELRQAESPWERALSILESLQPPETRQVPPTAAESASERRLVFLVRVVTRGQFGEAPEHVIGADDGADDTTSAATLVIEPRVQTRRGGSFTAGRPVALRALAEPTPDVNYLTPEDLRVTTRINAQKSWSGREHHFSARAALALVGHPRVFWADEPAGAAVDVITRSPTLQADHGPAGLRLRVEPLAGSSGIAVMREGERLVVMELSSTQLSVQRAIAQLPPIPPEGESRLRQWLGSMTSLFTVHSQFGFEGPVGALEALTADSRPVVQLLRAEPGLRVRVSVSPLGAAGPTLQPGEGLAAVAIEIAGRRVHCVRDLAAERRALAGLLEVAPALQAALGKTPLHVDVLQECLALLSALSTLGDSVLVVWPEGTPLVLESEAGLSRLRLVLDERGEWLHATGTLAVNEGDVRDLVRVLAQRTADGGYIALGDDRYLPLTRDLQEQLSALETANRDTTGNTLQLSPISLGFVSPWLKLLRAEGGLKVSARVAKQLTRIEEAYEITPELPKTFEAELRAYQLVGYRFLARLAHFGAGACLADDMGLGKTLMTLALLVSRATSGPALVVTPTSVRANWFDEALRFAPTLRMRRLDGADSVPLDTLEAFDVLVCSYTVMTQRIEQLERVRFATAVLDEAQSIKNGATQRAQAAGRLVAEARIALTGTPVENHLGDLHGIMSFLNPGLLGDTKRFDARFGKPIQRDRDERAQRQLRALIGPFMLRRRKSEVLRELPARTEITLRVEPAAAEQAFSEALRRSALARLQASDAPRAGSAVSILAEITRLRRAACHPQLIDADIDVGAVKLERLIELAHELRDGGHRALVFSQFVDFLHIVRARLITEGFTCQYLDGSTPEVARKRAVDAFQGGEGDLFLISLKAGGFGLNLTAADYVIHLDPWWNPAVEAQASDRAHRIGQERPVTIYRLVNAASIEERVLALHDRKQALAEELLSDSAEAVRLDPQALLALLAES